MAPPAGPASLRAARLAGVNRLAAASTTAIYLLSPAPATSSQTVRIATMPASTAMLVSVGSTATHVEDVGRDRPLLLPPAPPILLIPRRRGRGVETSLSRSRSRSDRVAGAYVQATRLKAPAPILG